MKLLALGCALALTATLTAGEVTTAWTQADLEADWIIQARVSPENLAVLAQRDAAGVNDGVISAEAEHQTQSEAWAWWQVELDAVTALDRIVVHNPKANVGPGAWFKVLLSQDGITFDEVHTLEGPQWPSSRRLEVPMEGRKARFVRVSAGGRDRLRLSEVEVFGSAEPTNNIALRRKARQSSFQERRAKNDPGDGLPPLVHLPVLETLRRGRALAADLATRGVEVGPALATFATVETALAALPSTAGVPERMPLYLQARRAVRQLAFANPLLAGCDKLLFLKRVSGKNPNTGPQFNSQQLRPGGGIWRLDGLTSGQPTVRCLTSDVPAGGFLGLDLSYDGKRLVFAYAQHSTAFKAIRPPVPKDQRPETSFYHLHEMDFAQGTIRRITEGKYDDFHASYLPDGDLVFVSTRRSTSVQVTAATAAATRTTTLPDCYLRCGLAQVHTLHRMRPDGSGLRTLSPTDTHEWYPTIDHDGRVIYARWDYVDRDARIAFGLWSSNPDGSSPDIVFGNYTREPFCIFEARPIPGSRRLICTGSAHHAHPGGPLLLLDPAVGVDGQPPLTNLTPEVCMPESQGVPPTYYQAPYPLSETYLLCAWSPRPLTLSNGFYFDTRPNDLGLYLYDAFGNRELIHRDPAIDSTTPIPLAPRAPAPVRAGLPVSDDPAPIGSFVLSDVYQGLQGVARGTIRRLRLVAVPPKPVAGWGNPPIGCVSYEPAKFVLGTVPVEADGSAHFVAPAGVALWFQALDADGLAVQTMRTVTYLQPGERKSCIGCHTPAGMAPPVVRPLAVARPASLIRPEVEGSWPLRFDRLVQPTIERLQAAGDPKLAGLDLSSPKDWTRKGRANRPGTDKGPAERYLWKTLVDHGGERSLYELVVEQDVETGFRPSSPQDVIARRSQLWEQLTAPVGKPLTADERARLALWMDTYAQYQGHFTPEQEAEIAALRERWKDLLEPADRR
jgi:hypothetical protein